MLTLWQEQQGGALACAKSTFPVKYSILPKPVFCSWDLPNEGLQ